MKAIRLLVLSIFAIFTLNVTAQSRLSRNGATEKNGSAQSFQDPEKIKAAIADLLNNKLEIFDKLTQVRDNPGEVKVLDDRIEFRIKDESTTLYFSDLADDPLQPVFIRKNNSVLSLSKFEFLASSFNNGFKKLIQLRENLLFFQNQFKSKKEEERKALFVQKVKEYHLTKDKPVVSEEQRKFIVQANLFSQQKNYARAIELYNKVLDIDPVAYPAAYSNLALLCAQVNNFKGAIDYMKKYLLLDPQASDSRSAQDKIYEWEAMAK
jgi:tetratricopeptide (TPR) repeat protein